MRIVGFIASIVVGLPFLCGIAVAQSAKNPPPDPGLFQAFAAGSWALPDAKDCEAESHRFAFSADQTSMTTTSKRSFTGVDGRLTNTSNYRILYAEKNKITMYLDSETRRTEAGDRVVWVLILESPSRYSWRRTDWKPNDTTAIRVRCRPD